MSQPFARGERSFGFCDICAFRCPYHELKYVVVKQKVTGTKACPRCWDEDHPQLMLGTFPVFDPQALREPRPDVNQNVERTLYVQLGAPEIPVIGATVGTVSGGYAGNVSISIF